jgi:hypothetical protein
MEALRAYLLSDKNIGMLESIIIDKLYETVSISLNRRDPLFKKNMMLVMTTIITDEISNLKTFDNKALMFINNIIIKETVGYIKNLVTQNQELERSSKLSEEGSDLFEKEDYFEELKIDKVVEPLEKVIPGPKYEETVLIFDQSTNNTDIKNVVSFELVSFSFDFSGYIVDEKNCNFCVDNEPIVVQHGNYTPELLVETLTKLTNLHFTINPVTEKVTISRPGTKSLTGTNKQKSSNIDFGVVSSINNLLGFENRTYILKNEDLLAINKHNITHPIVVDLNIQLNENAPDLHRILTDVRYNYPVHYKPNVPRKISIDRTDVKNVNINFDYISNRPYICYIKFNSLIF